MKSDAILLCTLATIFGSCWQAAAFFPTTAAKATPPATANANDAALAAGLLTYPDAVFMDGTNAAVSFQPRDPERPNERAAVYDPGDELLRALNAQLAASGQELGTLPEEPDYAETVFNELEVASTYDMLRKLEQDLREEQDVMAKSALMMKMLEDPTMDTLPLVYVEESRAEETNNLMYPGIGMSKRSRYSRRYPWKRHNRNRSTYDPELRYACTPTKEDVLKLLVNLHENRKGNHSKTVNFCNRKRPAKAIFTNIRFLG